MDPSGRLADLKLVSKYYPIANYSYPRHDAPAQQGVASRPSNDRSSLGSEGSAPGLVDDRTDSEVSVDDDYQYHAHAAELWDSFWQPGAQGPGPVQGQGQEKVEEPLIHPKKQYPALIPSPQQRRKRPQGGTERSTPAWPLPDSPVGKKQRKPAATYTAFPKPVMLHPKEACAAPPPAAPASSRPTTKPPQRPPRPDENAIPPCLKQTSPVTKTFATPSKSQKGGHSRPLTPTTRRPLTPIHNRPTTPLEPRPSTSMGTRPSTPWDEKQTIYAVRTTSATDLPMPDAGAPAPSPSEFPRPPRPQQPEPQSVFEDDDDSDAEPPHGRSFFRFHKRADSDTRRAAHAAESAVQRRRRARAGTAPTTPARQQPDRGCKTPTPGRKRPGGDVFGRMLGRRSR